MLPLGLRSPSFDEPLKHLAEQEHSVIGTEALRCAYHFKRQGAVDVERRFDEEQSLSAGEDGTAHWEDSARIPRRLRFQLKKIAQCAKPLDTSEGALLASQPTQGGAQRSQCPIRQVDRVRGDGRPMEATLRTAQLRLERGCCREPLACIQ